MIKINSDQNSNNKVLGFTLTEVLIIIALITILAAASLIALNPAEVMKRTRDSQRFQELASIHQSLALLEADQSPIDIGDENTVYISLPDASSTCSNHSLPSLPDGWSYECADQANYRNVDGSGWVPADFTQYSPGPPFSALPVDPVNKVEDELYYAYSVGSWHLVANMESEKYSSGGDNDQESTTGNFANSFEIGSDTTIVPVDLFEEDSTSTTTDSGAWNLASVSFSQSLDVSGRDGQPTGIALGASDTKLYMIGQAENAIYQYDLSTAGNISDVSFAKSRSTSDLSPTGITWSNDGTRMYEVDSGGDKIYQYDVATAWDIATAELSASTSTLDAGPSDIEWGDNGTKLYELGAEFASIYEYNVSTAWDISTASFLQEQILRDGGSPTEGGDGTPTGIAWKSDGTKLYMSGANNDKIYEYDVPTAWDVSTASLNTSINSQSTAPRDVIWNSDGTKMYEVDSDSDRIYEYTTN